MLTNPRDGNRVNGSDIDLNGYRLLDDVAARRGLQNGRHLTLDEARGKISRHFARHGEPDLAAWSGKITTLRWQQQLAQIISELVPQTMTVSGGGPAPALQTGPFNYV